MRAMNMAVLASLALATVAFAATADGPPVAPVRPVTHTYFCVSVTDPYRRIGDRNAPEFIAYMKAQGAYARGVRDRIPGRDQLQTRIAAHTGGGTIVTSAQLAGRRVFYMKRAPGENTFKLYTRNSVGAPERLLIDP